MDCAICTSPQKIEGKALFNIAVAPRAGAWIEIPLFFRCHKNLNVAPRAGAWIEIRKYRFPRNSSGVAPRAGAWIEMMERIIHRICFVSHPARVRGLKFW